MSYESPSIIDEPEQEEEKTPFSRSKELARGNSVVNQSRAYIKHVKEMAEKTGKSIHEIVAEESEELKRLGVNGFLEKNT
jgi:hypothetical protein